MPSAGIQLLKACLNWANFDIHLAFLCYQPCRLVPGNAVSSVLDLCWWTLHRTVVLVLCCYCTTLRIDPLRRASATHL